jgi:hypothetical protein
MTDLVDRLREQQSKFMTPILGQAANEIERLSAALVIIANPLADFKRQAEKDGDHLSPLAISIANDTEYLKEVARTALKEPKP